jgi:hypothetical protein
MSKSSIRQWVAETPRGAGLGVALLVAALGLLGCGSGGGTTDAGATGAPTSEPASEQLPPAAGARRAGQRACAGMTPLEAARHFEGPARKAGVKVNFAKFVAQPPSSTINSPGYPRLVAAIYASTLPPKQRAEAAAGCAERLALSSSGGQGSSKRATQEGLPSAGGTNKKGSN